MEASSIPDRVCEPTLEAEIIEFYTWVLVGDPSEKSLVESIPNRNEKPLPKPEDIADYLFDLSVGNSGRPLFRASTEAKEWFFAEAERLTRQSHSRPADYGQPDEFVVISFIARRDIEQIWGRTCSYAGNKYYQFLPVRFDGGCPYQHRFLAIRYLGKILPQNAEPLGIQFPIVDKGEIVSSNLWPHLFRIPLSSEKARDLFRIDERENVDKNSKLGVNAVSGSLFLPPVRILAQSDGPKEDSYFNPERVDLRRVLLKNTGFVLSEREAERLPESFSLRVNPYAPLNVQAVRLADDPLVRDILLDGGRISVDGQEGTPTKMSLDFIGSDLSPQAYRRRFFQEDPEEWVTGPGQFAGLRRQLQDDLKNLLPNGLDLGTMPESEQPRAWLCRLRQKYRDEQNPGPGTWEKLKEIGDLMESSGSSAAVFHRLVIDDPGKLGTRLSADHDLAEKLFITNLWRYPSGDDVLPDFDKEPLPNQAWRLALVEQLLELELKPSTQLRTAEERLRWWNSQKAALSWEREDDRWIIEVMGSDDEVQLWKYRYLLPLGSVLISKTLILDHPMRGRLDAGYRLG